MSAIGGFIKRLASTKRLLVGVILAALVAAWVMPLPVRAQPVPTDLSDGLVGDWRFDEGSGTTAADSSGNGNDGTLVSTGSSPTWVAPGFNDSPFALEFDGTGAFATAANTVNVGNSPSLDGLATHTLALWARFDPGYVGSGGQWANLIGRSSSQADFSYMLYVNNTGQVRAHLVQSNGANRIFDSPATVPTGEWVHLAQVADGSELRLYINGDEVDSIAYDGTIISLPTADTYIGQDLRGSTLLGTIDDARVYNRGLSPLEIRCLYEGCVRYSKTVDPVVTEITPDQTFTYTVTVENAGAFDLTGLSFTDDVSAVIDDATYNNDEDADIGTATFDGTDQITWNGDLDVGQTATITYSLTMNDPQTGDGELRNGVVGIGLNANCTEDPPTDPDCFTTTPLPVIESQKTLLGPSTPQAGDTVNYEFTITNTGDTAESGVSVADDLTGVLDDAVYNGDADASFGDVDFNSDTQRVIWSGDLAASGDPGDSVTVTFSVTVNGADNLADGILHNGLISADCPSPPIFDSSSPGYDPDCVSTTAVAAWMARKTISPTGDIAPGSTATYTIEVINTGATDLTGPDGPAVNSDLSDVLDDATHNNDEDATSGTPTFTDGTINWTGDLTRGQTATITYSVNVHQGSDLTNSTLVSSIVGSMNCADSPVTDPNDPNHNPDCTVSAQVVSVDAPEEPEPDGDEDGAVAAAHTTRDGLANTGQNAWQYIVLAGLMSAVGFMLVFKARKVRRATPGD